MVRRLQKSRLALIGKQVEALDAEIAKATAADEELARRNEVLTSIPDVGPAVAATLLSDMPELGHRRQGCRQSGRRRAADARVGPVEGAQLHPRRPGGAAADALHGGPVRDPPQPGHGRKYAEMRDRGKPAKVALTAVMRKLAVLANALLKQDRLWTPEPARA